MIDVALLVVVGIVTWTVAAEGAWGAAVMLISVLLSGLVAMDYFEPLADLLQSFMPDDWANRVDIIALIGLFAAGVFGLRTLAERFVPTAISVDSRLYDAGRWLFALMTGYVTMAFLLTALHTAPLPRDFLGFTPERKNLFGVVAPDREWLGFVQYVSEKSMRSSDANRIFDGTRFQVPGHDNDVWPTFVIRYASRRDSGGVVVTTTAPGAPAAPSSGGGGSPSHTPAPGGL